MAQEKALSNRMICRPLAHLKSPEGKVTLIETIMFPFCVLLWMYCWRWGYRLRGVAGGLIAVLIILPVAGTALGFLLNLICPFGYPVCRTGKCRDEFQYEFRRSDDGEYRLFCRCGTGYRKRGLRFYEVQPDGSERPYMVWRPFRGWASKK